MVRTFILCICLFLNLGAEIMLNLLFNTLLTITPHNTQKRRRRKERTTHGPLRRYSRLVTHPVLSIILVGYSSIYILMMEQARVLFLPSKLYLLNESPTILTSLHFAIKIINAYRVVSRCS